MKYSVQHVDRQTGNIVQSVVFRGKTAKADAVQWARARSRFNLDASCVLRVFGSRTWLAEFRHGTVNDSNDDDLPFEAIGE